FNKFHPIVWIEGTGTGCSVGVCKIGNSRCGCHEHANACNTCRNKVPAFDCTWNFMDPPGAVPLRHTASSCRQMCWNEFIALSHCCHDRAYNDAFGTCK